MNPLKLKFYLEVLGISVGIVFLIAIIPIQAFVEGRIDPLTVFVGMILWYTILYYNFTFQELKDKWFKR